MTRSDTNRPVLSEKNDISLNFRFKKKRDCSICLVKTKMLISCAVNKLCSYCIADLCLCFHIYAKIRFSHDAACMFF